MLFFINIAYYILPARSNIKDSFNCSWKIFLLKIKIIDVKQILHGSKLLYYIFICCLVVDVLTTLFVCFFVCWFILLTPNVHIYIYIYASCNCYYTITILLVTLLQISPYLQLDISLYLINNIWPYLLRYLHLSN